MSKRRSLIMKYANLGFMLSWGDNFCGIGGIFEILGGCTCIPFWNGDGGTGAMSGAHDPHYIEFIARLQSARKAKNLTQKKLGDMLNQPQSFVSKVETCERRLDIIEALEWCVALGIPLEKALPPSVTRAIEVARGEGR